MKIPYNVRKWAVEKLGGTMGIPKPDENWLPVKRYISRVTVLKAYTTVDPRLVNMGVYDVARDRLIDGQILALIKEKKLYRTWIDKKDPWCDKIWVEVTVVAPPKEEKDDG